MATITIEQLQSENRELRRLLQIQTEKVHKLERAESHRLGNVPEHRGDPENCPSPVCVEVRFALDRQVVSHE